MLAGKKWESWMFQLEEVIAGSKWVLSYVFLSFRDLAAPPVV